jgi:hypothetical protein
MTRTIPGSWPVQAFPFLNELNCTETSKFMRRYNCIAWAAGDTTRKWWPDFALIAYWPPRAPREETIGAFVAAFETLGYKLCLDERSEAGVEKIALYGIEQPDKTILPTHAARQLESGEWTSKLGDFEDISHKTLDDLNGPIYGRMICCMSRRRETQ